jgi:quercetin dioxygenase-like cupin family protein
VACVTRSARDKFQFAITLTAALALGFILSSAFGQADTAPTATRSALAQSEQVQGAPGRTLALSKVVIEPGARLAPHHHLGTQVAHIQSGVLTYTVERGSVTVRRGEADQSPKVVRSIKAGQTGRIRAGQWIVEQSSDIHHAANNGSSPVVIYLATLLKKGAPPSTPVPPGK